MFEPSFTAEPAPSPHRTTAWRIPLFYPFVPRGAVHAVTRTLSGRWIGQGPQVDQFEKEFARRFTAERPLIAVGAGTHALHLAYRLAGISAGDEVLTPVFSCVATSIPLLYQSAKVRFVDVEPQSMNIDPQAAAKMITERTKAIVCTHYGGLPCDMKALQELCDRHSLALIADAAHALGAEYEHQPIAAHADFSCFSFQAIKHISTGDGGALVLPDESRLGAARRLRWFGIDREAKLSNSWDNQIHELGYKYQMNDIAASLGLAALAEFDEMFNRRRSLFRRYRERLAHLSGLQILGSEAPGVRHAAWLFTVLAENRAGLEDKLVRHGVECGQVHYRNDRYAVFNAADSECPNMDEIEDRYLVLPLHPRMELSDVDYICDLLESGW